MPLLYNHGVIFARVTDAVGGLDAIKSQLFVRHSPLLWGGAI